MVNNDDDILESFLSSPDEDDLEEKEMANIVFFEMNQPLTAKISL